MIARQIGPTRRGVTLIELLVVMAIVMILLAAAARMMDLEPSKVQLRESARVANMFFVAAQAKAVELDRPAGILIERLENKPNAARYLYLVASPPPYAGDTFDARATIEGHQAQLPPGSGIHYLVHSGDLIKFDYKGPSYVITQVNSGASTVDFAATDGAEPPPPTGENGPGVPFQIFRKPKKLASQPLELPGGMAIDLTGSGEGLGGTFTSQDDDPIIITFEPSGRIHRVYRHVEPSEPNTDPSQSNLQPSRPNGTVFLLIGKYDQIDPGAEKYNLSDLSSLWVSIGHQSGRVVTSANARGNSYADARRHAATSQGKGGR